MSLGFDEASVPRTLPVLDKLDRILARICLFWSPLCEVEVAVYIKEAGEEEEEKNEKKK